MVLSSTGPGPEDEVPPVSGDLMDVSGLSMITISHMTPLVKATASEGVLRPGMLPPVGQGYKAEATSRMIEVAIEETKDEEGNARLSRALLHVFRGPLIKLAPVIFVVFTSMIFSSVVIKEVVAYIEDEDRSGNEIWYWVSASFLLPFLNNILFRYYEFVSFRMISVSKAGLTDILYRKLIRISEVTRQKASAGNLTNLLFSDAERASIMYRMLHLLWAAPLVIIAGLTMIVNGIGLVGLAGFGVFVIIAPIQAMAIRQMFKARKSIMTNADERVRRVSEIISGVKVIKMGASEDIMLERVNNARQKEMKAVRRMGISRAVMMSFMYSLTPAAGAMVFSIYAATGHTLTPSTVYYIVSLFGILAFPLMMLPMALSAYAEAKVSYQRIGTFLALPEADPEDTSAMEGDAVIAVRDGTFSWAVAGETDIPDVLKETDKKKGRGRGRKGKKETTPAATETETETETGEGEDVPNPNEAEAEAVAAAPTDVVVSVPTPDTDTGGTEEADLTMPVLNDVTFQVCHCMHYQQVGEIEIDFEGAAGQKARWEWLDLTERHTEPDGARGVRARFVFLAITANRERGRDSRIRQVKILGRPSYAP
ncbi:hypothetical protein KIPB_004756 [Kipferlia bialata]|uniref:ABC transmembrane type-1 domain-containing protein n=1 Tax=Kipferlia bialata TaxID=797122 RepID=A0A9K3CVX3_9EUKA|nr:hypothetical protein KIPB_004756 [Kipferlia bialata]|eukprot:g4756.t1